MSDAIFYGLIGGVLVLACTLLLLAVDLATRGPERRKARRAEREAWRRQRAQSVRRPLLIPNDRWRL